MKNIIFIVVVSVSVFSLANAAGARTRVSLNARRDGGRCKEAAAMRKFKLSRLRHQRGLRQFIKKGLLIRVPSRGREFYLDGGIGQHASANKHLYAHARPWTVRFIKWLGGQYWHRFKSRFKVTSLVRTCAYQRRLARRNVNAGKCGTSSHLSGATLDISKKGMSQNALRWMRKTLLGLERGKKVQTTEERRQSVFHIMVFPKKLTINTKTPAERTEVIFY